MDASRAAVPRGARGLQIALLAPLGVLLLAGIAISLVTGDVFSTWFFLGYAVPASLLIDRRPRNAVGWLVLGIGWALLLASPSWTGNPEDIVSGRLSITDALIVWSSAWGPVAVLASVLALGILFPEGRLPHGRWRWPAAVVLVVAVLVMLVAAFRPTLEVMLEDAEVVARNPFGLLPDAGFWNLLPAKQALDTFVTAELAAAPLLMLVRFIRSTGLERLQLRWLVAASSSLP